jgi:hypothetical protein
MNKIRCLQRHWVDMTGLIVSYMGLLGQLVMSWASMQPTSDRIVTIFPRLLSVRSEQGRHQGSVAKSLMGRSLDQKFVTVDSPDSYRRSGSRLRGQMGLCKFLDPVFLLSMNANGQMMFGFESRSLRQKRGTRQSHCANRSSVGRRRRVGHNGR